MGAKANRKVLRECLDGMSITDFMEPTEILKELYRRAHERIRSYTLLTFADDLGFGPSPQLRMMMTGQRSLTAKAARKIADGLWLRGEKRRFFMTLVEFTNARLPDERDRLLRLLTAWKGRATPTPVDERISTYLSHWLHPVLREAFAARIISDDVEEIRKALQFPTLPAEVRHSIDLLLDLKLLQRRKGKGITLANEKDIILETEVDSLAAVGYLQTMIGIAKEALTRVDETDREISGQTLCLPRSSIGEVKRLTQEYLDAVQALESQTDEPRDIFQVNVQFFPFTKVKS